MEATRGPHMLTSDDLTLQIDCVHFYACWRDDKFKTEVPKNGRPIPNCGVQQIHHEVGIIHEKH